MFAQFRMVFCLRYFLSKTIVEVKHATGSLCSIALYNKPGFQSVKCGMSIYWTSALSHQRTVTVEGSQQTFPPLLEIFVKVHKRTAWRRRGCGRIPMLENWPLFRQNVSTFGQIIQLYSHLR